jgi:hypothetical protein
MPPFLSQLGQSDVLPLEVFFHFSQVIFRVHSHRVVGSLNYVNRNSVLEKPKLLERLCRFQLLWLQLIEPCEGVSRVSIKSQVLVVSHAA